MAPLRHFVSLPIYLFWHTNPVVVNIASGATALGWAARLFQQPHFFSEKPVYSHFQPHNGEFLWACIFVMLGCAQLGRVFLHVSHRTRFHLGVECAAMLIWMYIVTQFIIVGNYYGPISTAYIVLSFGCVWTFMRAGCTSNRYPTPSKLPV